MDWETYYKMFQQYKVSTNQTRIASFVTSRIFQDYPNKLPEDLRTIVVKVPETFSKLAKELAKLGTDLPPEETIHLDLEVDYSPFESFEEIYEHPLYDPALSLFLAQVLLKTPTEIDYQRIFLHQELIMVFAHLDAFMGDSLRVICQVKPEKLKRERKTIAWEAIHSCNSQEEIYKVLTEQYVYEFGILSIPKRLKLLKKEFDIEFPYSDDKVSLLEKAQKDRDVVVHNGGKVSQDYIDNTGLKDLEIGEYISITADHLDDIWYLSLLLVNNLFVSVSKKFFDVDTSSVSGVLYRDIESTEYIKGTLEVDFKTPGT